MKYKITSLIAASIMLLLTGCKTISVIPTDVTGTYLETTIIDCDDSYQPVASVSGMEFIAHEGYTAMYANVSNGEFVLVDLRNDQIYTAMPRLDENTSSPALIVTDVHSESGTMKTKRSDMDAEVKVQKTDKGIQVWYTFMEEKYAIPVEYSLYEDGFRARVFSDQIIEKGDFRVFSIAVLPYFNAQLESQKGFMLVPDGSGALIHLQDTKAEYASYRSEIYGDSYLTVPDYVSSVKENALIPFVGMQTEKSAFLAMSDIGASSGSIYASVKGQDSAYYHIYYQFDVRKRQNVLIGNPEAFDTKTVTVEESGPISISALSVRYYLLNSTPDDGLMTMATVARNIVNFLSPEISSAPDNCVYVSTIGGYTMKKPILGIRIETTQVITSFSDAQEIIKDLQSKGVDKLTLSYTGFNKNALRNRMEAQLRFDKQIGTLTELQRLQDTLGFNRLLLEYNPVTFARNGEGFRVEKSSIRDLSLNKYTLLSYKRNTFHPDKDQPTSYLLKVDQATDILKELYKQINQSLKTSGIQISKLGNKLYGDYSENGFRRDQAQQHIQSTFEDLAKNNTLFADEPNFYAAIYSSALLNLPDSSSDYDIVDENVPFYQMVFSGKRQMVSRPLNLTGDHEEALLQCIQFGMIPQYELISNDVTAIKDSGLDSFYSAAYKNWSSQLVDTYKRYFPVYESTRGKALENYQCIQKDVYLLTYSDGIHVMINKTDHIVETMMGSIDAKSFKVMK